MFSSFIVPSGPRALMRAIAALAPAAVLALSVPSLAQAQSAPLRPAQAAQGQFQPGQFAPNQYAPTQFAPNEAAPNPVPPKQQAPARKPVAQTAPAQQKPAAAAQGQPAQAVAPAQPSTPVRTETIVYDNWVVTCRDTVGKSSKRNCSAVMQISNKKTNKSIFVWQIGQDQDGKAVFGVRTPLGVKVQEGVQLSVGTGKPRKIDFVACAQNGCDARGPFDDAFAKELVAASEATAAFVLADGKTVNLKLPLTGIDKALPAIRR
ncbi:MAG: Invasion associated locus family protein [Xanthobacteraceae bacterium]|nr:Invasion associated locus family protein [Xanthobacteraceae bacterium]